MIKPFFIGFNEWIIYIDPPVFTASLLVLVALALLIRSRRSGTQ
jgi:hypothetical protein